MMSTTQRLVYMANQIARNFEAQGQQAAVKGTADHIRAFWEPRMKAQIFDYLDGGGKDLSPAAAAAIRHLREPA
jgi:formate dehydrogenase subunit delta